MAILLNINMMNVNTMQNNTGIFTGENQQFGWDTHQKQSSNNFFLGMFNTSPANFNFIFDADVFDTPINDQDIKPGFQTQQA